MPLAIVTESRKSCFSYSQLFLLKQLQKINRLIWRHESSAGGWKIDKTGVRESKLCRLGREVGSWTEAGLEDKLATWYHSAQEPGAELHCGPSPKITPSVNRESGPECEGPVFSLSLLCLPPGRLSSATVVPRSFFMGSRFGTSAKMDKSELKERRRLSKGSGT